LGLGTIRKVSDNHQCRRIRRYLEVLRAENCY